MPSITSGTFDTRAGTGDITLTQASLPSGTMTVSDFGILDIEYDIEDNTEDASDVVYFVPNGFEFKVFDGLGNGDSLFDYIDSNLSSTDKVEVVIDFDTDGGVSFADTLYFTKDEIEYDRTRREVSIKCFYELDDINVTISDIFTNYSSDVDTFNDGTGTRDCMATKLFIENVIDQVFPSGTLQNSSNEFSADPFVDGNDTWVVFKDHDGTLYEQTDLATEALYRLAAVDGSIIGAIMGINFFVHRLDSTYNETISESNVLTDSLTIQPALSNYRALSVWAHSNIGSTNVSSWTSYQFLANADDEFNPDAQKELHVSFQMFELQPAEYSATSPVDEFLDDGFGGTSNTSVTITSDLNKGDIVVPISGSTGLGSGDNIWFQGKKEMYEIDSANSNRIILKTPIRDDISEQFNGSNREVFHESGTARNGLAQGAANAYTKAYNASRARRVELTLLDVDTLLPHETFTFDSTFPTVLDGQTYRPSRMKYNFVDDTIQIEAYQIS